MPQSPMALHGRLPKLLPPETPKSKNQELFLSPGLELQSPGNMPITTNKPIREISNNLKTRLNYAYVKMQHNIQHSKRSIDDSVTSNTVKPSSYNNVFAQDSDIEAEADISSPDVNSIKQDPHVKSEEPVENSAQAAFLKALQSPKKKQRSLSSNHPKITRTSSSSQPSEVEAIETLMSLSSPQKRRPSGSVDFTLPPPPTASITTNENNNHDSDTKYTSDSLGSPKLTKPVTLNFHSEVQTDIETDLEPQSDD